MKLIYFGNDNLRKISSRIEDVNEEIFEVVEFMKGVISNPKHLGVGLAGPQVGFLKRIFITMVDEEENFNEKNFRVYINPELSCPSKVCEFEEEGCLSIPNVRANVLRPSKIVVKAQNLQGEFFEEELRGFEARVVMHENDHLNGKLFIDRLDKREKNAIKKYIKKNRSRGI